MSSAVMVVSGCEDECQAKEAAVIFLVWGVVISFSFSLGFLCGSAFAARAKSEADFSDEAVDTNVTAHTLDVVP